MGVAAFEKLIEYPAIARRLFGACVFNNRLFIAGGLNTAGTYLSDVWSSADGVHWDCMASGANSFNPAREGCVMLVHDNRIYILTGYNATDGYLGDVWMSEDGTKWERTISSAFGRDDGAGWSLNNKIFVAGGDQSLSGTYFDDCYSSPDGVNYIQEIAHHKYLQRTVPGYCVFNKRMHMICGYDGTSRLQTAAYSADGLNWTQTPTTCGLPAVDDIAACVFDNKIVVTGGYALTRAQAVDINRALYYSEDGEKYVCGCPDIGFNVYQHKMLALKEPNRLFLLFGYDGTAVRTDVWESTGNWQANRV